ncbi:MAG: VWA domain-containing protein [Betaproteobacteria bacterium]
MRFVWPEFLWLLAIAPLAVWFYVWLLRRRRKAALRFPSVALLRAAQPGQAWRRHVAPAVFLLALLAGILAGARPSAVITLPSQQRTIILAIDVSLSMRATDVQPNRLAAAQEAAKSFVSELPSDVRIGIVSFAGTAAVVQAPTNSKEDLIAAIERLQLDRQTAIGSGVVVSLAALFPEDTELNVESMVLGRRSGRSAERDMAARKAEPKDKEKKAFTPVEPGSNASKAIILLTDGRRTTGPLPSDTARMAADRGIKVYTVGFGTAAGASVGIEGYSIFMAFDEETLRTIADITRAEYFHASTAEGLKKVYQDLSSRLVLQREYTEIGMLFAALAAVLLVAAAAFSLAWAPRGV